MRKDTCPNRSNGASDSLGKSSQTGEDTNPRHFDLVLFQGFEIHGQKSVDRRSNALPLALPTVRRGKELPKA